jgi:CheY-like chemotaxis protein
MAVQRAPLVLVVDDSLTVRRVTQRLLTREGYRVTLAKDGMDALERLAEERPGGHADGHRDASHGRLRPGAQRAGRRESTPSFRSS